MIRFLSQLDHLRGVQRNFGSGPSQTDMVEVFTNIMVVAGPLILVMAMWYYRHVFVYTILRSLSGLFAWRSGKILENYLVSKGVMLEIFLYSGGHVGKKICNARVTEVVRGKMHLELINVSPTALKLKHKRVICYTKPFAYKGRKINAFFTLVSKAEQRGSVIKSMQLMSPIRYRFVIRRKSERKKIAREGMVRVKAWDGRLHKTFWMKRPDLQTVNNPAKYGKKTRLFVENISAGGMRLLILHPQGHLPPLNKGNHLVMRVSVYNPKSKKFAYFNVIGTIRSRFKGKGGAIGLGIQFTAEGEKVGGIYKWTSISGELEQLNDFIENIKK